MAKAAAEAKAPKAKKEKAAKATDAAKRDVFRMADEGVINFGKDDEGKDYSSENSPKRGDKTKDLWSKYRPGMTVKEALDSGFTRSNIRRDRRAGYITIQNPEPAAAE
jgi:membrane protein involved in colicin uptake